MKHIKYALTVFGIGFSVSGIIIVLGWIYGPPGVIWGVGSICFLVMFIGMAKEGPGG